MSSTSCQTNAPIRWRGRFMVDTRHDANTGPPSASTSSKFSYQCEVGRGIYTLPNSPSHRNPEMRVCESDPTCIDIGCYLIRPSGGRFTWEGG